MKKYIEVKYFCKSKWLLYPLLELATHKTETYPPKGTYLFFEDHSILNYELILLYNNCDIFFTEYERKKLINHKLIRKVYETDKGNVYIFDISHYKDDIELFLRGEYSKLSQKFKVLALRYNGDVVAFNTLQEGRAIHAVLFPEHYREAVAEELGIDKKHLTELAPLYDLEKETLYATIKERSTTIGDGDSQGIDGYFGSD